MIPIEVPQDVNNVRTAERMGVSNFDHQLDLSEFGLSVESSGVTENFYYLPLIIVNDPDLDKFSALTEAEEDLSLAISVTACTVPDLGNSSRCDNPEASPIENLIIAYHIRGSEADDHFSKGGKMVTNYNGLASVVVLGFMDGPGADVSISPHVGWGSDCITGETTDPDNRAVRKYMVYCKTYIPGFVSFVPIFKTSPVVLSSDGIAAQEYWDSVGAVK